MEPIRKIAQDAGLLVFEDAAPAAGAVYQNQKVGGIGDAGAFSFFPDKNMTTGEGGMLTTNSDEIAEKARILKKNGAKERYHHTEIGWNFKLSDINAALGISQLKKLPNIVEKRNKIAENYSMFFKELLGEEVIIPSIKENCSHTFNIYNIRFKNENVRNRVKDYLHSKKVETRICFPPVHLQPIYKKLLTIPEGLYPVAEECAKTTLCLPMFIGLTSTQQESIVNHVRNAIKN